MDFSATLVFTIVPLRKLPKQNKRELGFLPDPIFSRWSDDGSLAFSYPDINFFGIARSKFYVLAVRINLTRATNFKLFFCSLKFFFYKRVEILKSESDSPKFFFVKKPGWFLLSRVMFYTDGWKYPFYCSFLLRKCFLCLFFVW